MGRSAPICWFELLSRAWRIAVDQSGAGSQVMMSYERGNRKELGHLQGPKTHEQLLGKIRRWMKVALVLNAGQYKCKIGLAFVTGQTWEFIMGGYVQKDMEKPHYLFFMYPPIDDGACVVCFSYERWHYLVIFSLTLSRALRSAQRSALRSARRSAVRSALRSARYVGDHAWGVLEKKRHNHAAQYYERNVYILSLTSASTGTHPKLSQHSHVGSAVFRAINLCLVGSSTLTVR